MRSSLPFGDDGIARPNLPAVQHDAHDPRPAHELTVFVAVEDSWQQAGLKRVDLPARIAQAGHFNDRIGALSAALCRVEVRAGPARGW